MKISATLRLRVSHFLPTFVAFFQSFLKCRLTCFILMEMCFAIPIKSTLIYLESDAFYGCAQRNCYNTVHSNGGSED